jgi:UPF0755 protein
VLVVAVVVVSALASLLFYLNSELDRPMAVPGDDYVLHVPSGSSLSLLAIQLSDLGMLESHYPLRIHSRLTQLPPIQAGDYLVERGSSLRELLNKLIKGDVIRYQVTFPEGRSIAEWLKIVNSHDKFADKASMTLADLNEAFKPPSGDHLEGWFFPDTYTFGTVDAPLSVFQQAHVKMVKVLEEEWAGRSGELPVKTPYEALILASIIEKETGVAEERGAIAGVFTRRLEQGMRLQTDPTVIYGLGENFDGNLTRDHLREENPYNSYLINGLPPTPITNPGRDAIHAALHPKAGTELFFVAKGDGSHQFSTTLEEHEKAVREYQLRRANNYRSAPQ